jgi:hypothetical protein
MGLIEQGLYSPFTFSNGGFDNIQNFISTSPFNPTPQPSITNPSQQFQIQAPAPFTLNDYMAAMQMQNPIQTMDINTFNQPEGVRQQMPTSPRPVSQSSVEQTPQNTNQTARPNPFFSSIQGLYNTLSNIPNPAQTETPTNPPAGTPPAGSGQPPAQNQFTSQQQAWFNANPGWQSDLMKAMLGGQQFGFDPMNIQWQNFNNGQTENITRALGVINNPQELAKLLGGEVVTSPFATFGTTQRDQYIRMPNGQMIDASAIGSLLGNAASSQNPFNALSDVINLMGVWNQQHTNDPNINTDAINLVERGVISPQAPPGWDPSKFAGGNPTYTPSGPVPGNPSNPGMGTSNPVQFQGGQMQFINGPNGFPIFNNITGNIGTPQMPNPGGNTGTQPPSGGTPQAPATGTPNTNQNAPLGSNMNSQYFMPQGRGGLYAQSGNGVSRMSAAGGGGGRYGGGLYSMASGGNEANTGNPFGAPKQSANSQIAGNLPNGSSLIGK